MDQRAQVRRDHRQRVEHHPLGAVARALEGLNHLEALDHLLALLGACRLAHLDLEPRRELLDVDLAQELPDSLGADRDLDLVAVDLAVLARFLLGEDLLLLQR